MMRLTALFILISSIFGCVLAQSGQYAYRFLELPYSAHTAALGGSNVSLDMDGINGAMNNPGLLSDETDNELALNYTSYLADVSMGYVAYGKNIKGNLLAAGVQYVNYGDFEGRDEYNLSTGTFTAKDFAINLLYAKKLDDKWTAGLNFKPIFSNYENYSSFGLAVDLGLSYVNKEKNLVAGLVFANIGQQVTAYEEEVLSLPFNVSVSLSKKFTHAPIRFFFTAHHLNVWDLEYTNTITTQTLSGEEEASDISWYDMLFRHTIFGIDLVPGKRFYATVSYNHQRGRELTLSDVKTWAGISFGAGIKLSKFNIGFAASQYQKGIMTYQFSLRTGLNSFKF